MAEAFGISIGASLITVLLLGMTRILWSYQVENLWLRLACREVLDISGSWAADYDDTEHSYIESMIVKQHGWRLRGEVTVDVVAGGAGDAESRIYEVFGRIRGESVVCHFTNADRGDTRCGAMVLHVKEGGRAMSGKYLRQHSSGNVESYDIHYRRKPAASR